MIRSVLVMLTLGFLAIPLARPSNDEKTPTVQSVYYRAVRIPLAIDAPSRKNIYSVTTENTEEKQLTTDGHSFNPVLWERRASDFTPIRFPADGS